MPSWARKKRAMPRPIPISSYPQIAEIISTAILRDMLEHYVGYPTSVHENLQLNAQSRVHELLTIFFGHLGIRRGVLGAVRPRVTISDNAITVEMEEVNSYIILGIHDYVMRVLEGFYG